MVLMASGVIGWSDWCEVLGFLCCSARLLSNPLSSKTWSFIWMFHLHSELKWCGYLKLTTAIHWKQNFPWTESHLVSKVTFYLKWKILLTSQILIFKWRQWSLCDLEEILIRKKFIFREDLWSHCQTTSANGTADFVVHIGCSYDLPWQ